MSTRALKKAALGGDVAKVESLLAGGLDPSSCAKDGITALHLAASLDRVGVVEVLLGAGASPSVRSKALQTPLHTAAVGGAAEVVRVLLAAGAELDALDKTGRSPLMVGIVEAFSLRKELEKLLVEGPTATYEVINGRVLRLGEDGIGVPVERDELRALVSAGVGPEVLRRYQARVEAALVLATAGAHPSLASRAGFTPLHAAAELGEAELIEALAVHPMADWALGTKGGALPIHQAGRSGRPDGVAAVLRHSSEHILAVDDKGYTPLHFAADIGAPEALFSLLLDAGADVAAQSSKALDDIPAGITPPDLARYWSDHKAARFMEAYASSKGS